MKKTCAIYTRKSTDERLDMEFNTLDAQRESCEAYIISQKSEGWRASPELYDDGGFSGGSLERPALKQLISDIKLGKINVIVVYKIDRLTRSLSDFSKLVDVFDQYNVTFVSVTQSFNTTTSMGRLTLNVLLSFAQFEREVCGERIRDKIAASKAKGMWQGGRAPFGFDIGDRQLITNKTDAPKAKEMFELYIDLGCVRTLERELKIRNVKSRKRTSKRGLEYGGAHFSRGALYQLLRNPVYIGKISHKGEIHEGLHDEIISNELWDSVQKKLQDQSAHKKGTKKQKHNNLLSGLVFDENGNHYTTSFTNKNGVKYRYYFNPTLAEDKEHPNNTRSRFPSYEIEKIVEENIRQEIQRICGNIDNKIIEYVVQHNEQISSSDLVCACVEKIIVHYDYLLIKIKTYQFHKIVQETFNIEIPVSDCAFELNVAYQTKRGKAGAIILKPDSQDIFDIPQGNLKRLVQGVVWRDEHFAGSYIKDIAQRENFSDKYVRNRIIESFKILSQA